jgi:hypothetical protein
MGFALGFPDAVRGLVTPLLGPPGATSCNFERLQAIKRCGETAMPRKIKINSASADELDAVPQLQGHGFEIIRYRSERGRFGEIRQLEEVPGMTGHIDGLEALLSFD